MLNIIIRHKDRPSWKGKTISEMAKNLASEGFPPEVEGEDREKVMFLERKHGPNVFSKQKKR